MRGGTGRQSSVTQSEEICQIHSLESKVPILSEREGVFEENCHLASIHLPLVLWKALSMASDLRLIHGS